MTRIFIIVIGIAFFAAGCGTQKPVTGQATSRPASNKNTSLRFIDNVSIHTASHVDRTGNSSSPSNPYTGPATEQRTYSGTGIEHFSPLRFKYAILMDASVEEVDNEKLLGFIDEWYGAKYRYGGSSKDGIDCSAFVASMMSTVYGINNLPRISKDQYTSSRHIKRSELHEGDLVFFHTLGKRKSVTHVGMYLRNNKFIHASISGVMISSIDDGYYAQHYVGAGRVME